MNTASVYNDVIKVINKEQNGLLTADMFNSYLRRAELYLLDFLTGDIGGQKAPLPYLTQKNKDWLSPFITSREGVVSGGRFQKPEDYYVYENMFLIGGEVECDEEGDQKEVDRHYVSIEIMDSSKFDKRSETWIKKLKPDFGKPISKIVGKFFYFNPADLGSVKLEYIRYPKYGSVKSVVDPQFNDNMIVTNVALEWDEYAREYFVNFIVDQFSINTRDGALMNQSLTVQKGRE